MLNQILTQFEKHSLQQQAKVALMDRVDKKYLLKQSELMSFLQHQKPKYSILDIDSQFQFDYETLYFDTPNLNLFHHHQNGKLNRHKVRLRHYVQSNATFLEVKFRSNKNRTMKTRLDLVKSSFQQRDVEDFLSQYGPNEFACLLPTLRVSYKRITLVDFDGKERVTIDTDLRFYSVREKNQIQLPDTIIIEVKNDQHTLMSPSSTYFRARGIRPIKFSKYCMGLCMTDRTGKIKKNNFKPNLMKISPVQERFILPLKNEETKPDKKEDELGLTHSQFDFEVLL